MSQKGNDAVQARYEQVIGFNPRDLCATARALDTSLNTLFASIRGDGK